MHRLLMLLAASLLLMGAVRPAHAMTAEEAKQACTDLQQAAEEARKDMIQVAIPRQDPAKTFNDATQSCLQNIANVQDIFHFRNITLAAAEAILRQMAMKMISEACQAATSEFNRQVAEATATVNDAGGGYVTAGAGAVAVTIAPPGYIPPANAQAAKKETGFFSGLLNWISGDKQKDGQP